MTDYLANLSGLKLAKQILVRCRGKHRIVRPDESKVLGLTHD